MRLLVKAVDATHGDVAKAARGAYKRGDVVVAMPDGHVWGRKEGLPVFLQIDATGVTPDDVRPLLAPRLLPEFGQRQTLRRDRALALTTLPAGVRNALTTTGRATVSRAQFLAASQKKA